jgi:hypothetical protein
MSSFEFCLVAALLIAMVAFPIAAGLTRWKTRHHGRQEEES